MVIYVIIYTTNVLLFSSIQRKAIDGFPMHFMRTLFMHLRPGPASTLFLKFHSFAIDEQRCNRLSRLTYTSNPQKVCHCKEASLMN